MSLKLKVILVLLVLFGLMIGAHALIEQQVMYPRFVSLEREEATKDLERCRQAIAREFAYLDIACREWSAWDDTYRFIREGDRDYLKSNLTPEAFADAQLSLLFYYDLEGHVVWGEARDFRTLEVLDLPEFSLPGLPPVDALLQHDDVESSISGVVMTGRGPMMVASRPIVDSEGAGPMRGTLVVGRLLDKRAVDLISAQIQVKMRIQPLGAPETLPIAGGDEGGVASGVSNLDPVVFDARDDMMLRVFTTLPDLSGAPALLMRIDVPRTILARGRTAIEFASSSIICAAIFLLVVLWLLLHRTVVGPITKLTQDVAAIIEGEDLSCRIVLKRKDELGTLAREFDLLMRRLAESNARLQHDALHDSLTGLPNRAYILDRIGECVARAQRTRGYRFALLFLDIDRFKPINDTLGHDVGDRMLVEIADRLRACVRATDIVGREAEHAVARLGGDEFVVVLDDICEESDAEIVADRVSMALSEPFQISGHEILSGTSIGVACSDTAYHSADDMLRDADAAMYRAKSQGGAGFAVARLAERHTPEHFGRRSA